MQVLLFTGRSIETQLCLVRQEPHPRRAFRVSRRRTKGMSARTARRIVRRSASVGGHARPRTAPFADEARRDALTDKRSRASIRRQSLRRRAPTLGQIHVRGRADVTGQPTPTPFPRTADTRVRCLKTSPNRPPTGTAVRRPPGHRTFFTEASAGQPLTTKPTAKRAPSGIGAIGNPLLRIPDLRGKVGRTEHCANQAEIVVTGSPVAL